MTLTSDLVSRDSHRVWCISSIVFKVGISKLVRWCILSLWSAAYYLLVTVTMMLTSDLVSKMIVSRANLLYQLRLESQIWNGEDLVPFCGHCDLDL